jgi:hypothetical protein
MYRFLICDNAKCCFVLDCRINGRLLDGVQQLLTKCPSCGCNWSSMCPSCGQALAVKSVAGLPRRVCCEPRTHLDGASNDHRSLVAAAQFGV